MKEGIQNIYAVLCHRALDDAHTKNMSLIETFGQVQVTVRPELVSESFVIHLEYVLATYWVNTSKEDVKGVLTIDLQLPTGKEVPLGEVSVEAPAGNFAKVRINIGNILLSGEGWYYFILRVKQEKEDRFRRVATIPLRIVYKIDENAPMIDMEPLRRYEMND